ncbi:S-methyl-5'-thioadenosine phosphorylase [Bradymonas sediminis]|uniref:S-methyl-5'-thioadenosine phosphorylase n=1 Tax=Bradymonas sediminis TaxID=1548548 RepID=A0A2Z4FMN6_9DELT|nr:S-methyl-5'-thioadenosine phosphorylase [Bradymonas sediminis]AWV89954.1 S-methyl-5'-thioadenosine phosphorylase [Bradymonas sediminis]TDP62175.1 5'-methylthioadenosine phosphorylase [Bradymonas sediminis]
MSDIYSDLGDKRVPIGVIGGSGLYQMEGIDVIETVEIDTPFGPPSAPITIANVGGRRVAFLPRHGLHHEHVASNVPYRANIWALKKLGVFWCIAVNAVGSLAEEVVPGEHFVIPDQTIDKTYSRHHTLYDDVTVHVGLSYPFHPMLRQTLLEACRAEGIETHDGSTLICMEGPAFSTRAESELHRSWGAKLVGMTSMPEARLAREAEICYACIALPTDYDVWRDAEEVDVSDVMQNMKRNLSRVHGVLQRVIPSIDLEREAECDAGRALEYAIMTHPSAISESTLEQFRLTIGKYISHDDSAD